MGLFDSLIEKAQAKVGEKTNELNKKIETLQNKITTVPFDALIKEAVVKPKKKEKTPKQSRKVVITHSQKSDISIEGISKQILVQRDNIRKNGFKEYEFIANRDCCEICAELNGKHFLVLDLKIGINAPPMHEGCKCSIAAYEDSAEYEAWLDFISKGGTTKQWEAMKNAKRG